MAEGEEIVNEDGPKVYLETSFMRDNEIIAGIRELRRAFAAQYWFDLWKISEAAMKIALGYGFKTAVISANPNFHYPTATAVVV